MKGARVLPATASDVASVRGAAANDNYAQNAVEVLAHGLIDPALEEVLLITDNCNDFDNGEDKFSFTVAFYAEEVDHDD